MRQKVDLSELQEQHLDAMIGLAFDLEDAEEALRLTSEPDPALTMQEEEQANAILQTVLARLDVREKAARKQRRKSRLIRWIPWVIEVAACLALVLAIAMPVAVANSTAFRSKVLRLLFEPDEEQGGMNFSFVEDPNAAFFVPEEWTGEFFPSYIPEGFTYWNYDSLLNTVEFRGADENHYILFSEYDHYTTGFSGTDGATISHIDIYGNDAVLMEGYLNDGIYTVDIIWANDEKWFWVDTFGIDTHEAAIEIARSVRKILE